MISELEITLITIKKELILHGLGIKKYLLWENILNRRYRKERVDKMFECKTRPTDEKDRKFIEYNLLFTINMMMYNDGVIDKNVRDRIDEKLKRDYKLYRSA